ncbi:hypothetical protein K432DRAFT_407675 [Lepidopterella palustris CBS 459.81]|uniref:Apple domain-containing protein n=1 Tax=Lepidopterella palustris CBS 459.81 TaxID=1314670 RepID=A0A8E2JBZ5_9PEZI|nr:hypothetical protein K432DRAFT_407675 [Lepidopterella palustris CBS 459.81]
MFFNLALIVVSLFCVFSQTSALPEDELAPRDLVHEVVVLLELLHASAFCSSFAPQPTVVVTNTVQTSQTVTTSPTSTLVVIASNTASTTTTVIVTQTIVVLVSNTVTVTQTNTATTTSTATSTSTTSTPTTITTNVVVNPPAKLAKRSKPSDNVISSACHSYIPAPTTSTTLTYTSTFTDTAVQTQTTTSSVTSATTTLTTTLSQSITVSSTATTSVTTTLSTTQISMITTTTVTTLPIPTTTTHTYSIVTAGTGCGDIVYYNYLQDNVVTEQQCLDFCDSQSGCQSVMLQCSASEPCECTINSGPYANGDLQCGLPSQYYGEFTWYNKIS